MSRAAADAQWWSETTPEYADFEAAFGEYQRRNLRCQAPEGEAGFIAEHLDSESELDAKVAQLRGWVLGAQRIVVYTGAGISTASGLPDYRGPDGVWTRYAKQRLGPADTAAAPGTADAGGLGEGALERAEPAAAHRWLAAAVRAGVVAHVITTNVDDLFVRAGLRQRDADSGPDPLAERVTVSELHGNAFTWHCSACRRPARSPSAAAPPPGCCPPPAAMQPTVVPFLATSAEVPSMEAEYDRAWVQCRKADLLIAMGSSLSVPTACDLVEEIPQGSRLVVVNRQRTPKDHLAAMRIGGDCDTVLAMLGDPAELAEQRQSADAPAPTGAPAPRAPQAGVLSG